MVKLTAFCLTAVVAIAVMAVSPGSASAQRAVWTPSYDDGPVASGYDGAIIKVRRRGRGRGGRGGGYWGNAAGAAVIGGIIGGAIANQQRYYSPPPAPATTGNAHLDWCYSRYRSYRAYDNTYQPYGGPRRQCISPYY